MKDSNIIQNILLIVLLLTVISVNFFLLFAPFDLLFNQIFTPCENGFSYSKTLKKCECVDPFFGDKCEQSKCVHGSAVLGDYGWSCQCDHFWFGKFCDLCGTYDGVNGTCFGDAPYPNSNLCRSDEYNFGRVEFVGSRCDSMCFIVNNARSITGDAFTVYDMLLQKAPQNVVGCPENSCYGCDLDTGDALCVDGFLKSLNSRECDLNCGPCNSETCRPCSRRGECVLRGSPVCICDPRTRGSGCESLCPGIVETFNGLIPTLSGSECYANGICNDFAVCECFQDVAGTDRFIDDCKYECPVNDGLVCNGHGSCQLNNEGAYCECDTGWFGEECTCSDGSVDPKTCLQGDCSNSGECICYQNDIQGYWDGQFCTQCSSNYFTESTSCLQYCNPETTCSNHADTCIVLETVFASNGVVQPCTYDATTKTLVGTCATCSCNSNFNDLYYETPLFNNFFDSKSLAYGCTDCDSNYYPKADTQSFDATICNVECTLDICSNQGVCLRDSGLCACYGNCPVDATTYDGECLSLTSGMQPHFDVNSNCGQCQDNWGPNIDMWQASCIYFCNPLATAEDDLPSDCYVNGNIINECVFCSGRADNCSSFSGEPTCNCVGDYTGRYCQNTCASCNNGVCEDNKLYNWFLLDIPEYNKKDAESSRCTCLEVDAEDRSTFEEEMYTLVSYALPTNRPFLNLPPDKIFFGDFCASTCKSGSDGSICNSFGNCISKETVGLAGNLNCDTDADCNIDPNNPFVENSNYFCHLSSIPKFWQYIYDLQTFESCDTGEVTFIKQFIKNNDWHEFCYNYISTTTPSEIYHNYCSDCSQIVHNPNFWHTIDQSCTDFMYQANQKEFIKTVENCGTCAFEVATFDWEAWCELPGIEFTNVCPTECVNKFKEVDWVNDNGFCATLNNFVENTFLQDVVCEAYNENKICQIVGNQENFYDTNTACFIERESVKDDTTNTIIINPYSGSLRNINCRSVNDNHPEVCSSTTIEVNKIKQPCDPSILNVRSTGLNQCELRDQEYNYCLISLGQEWLESNTTCLLNVPVCLYCGDGNDLYTVGTTFDIENKNSNNYNPTPSKCCRPNDFLTIKNSIYQCHDSSSYETVCQYQNCKSKIASIDWTSKLNALDTVKNINNVDIPLLQKASVRRSLDFDFYCDSRKTLDETVDSEISLASFNSYCDFVNNLGVGEAETFPATYVLNEDEKNDLDIIKNSWWNSNIPFVPIQEYNFALYYNSGNSNLLENTLTFTVSDNINFKIFSTWLKIEEVNNDYMFSLEMQNQESQLLFQIDIRSKQLYFNGVQTELYTATNGWHHLQVYLNEYGNQTDIVWKHELNNEKILLNQNVVCLDCVNSLFDKIVLRKLGRNNIKFHDIRFVEDGYEPANTYLKYSLTQTGLSSIGIAECTEFKTIPDIMSTICPDSSCQNILESQNWGIICRNYFTATSISDDEKTSICSDESDCLARLNSWDYKTYYNDYTYNDRPAQTRTSECSTVECDELLENFDYVDLCSNNLREVSESCSSCQSTFDNWLSSFPKEQFCTNIQNTKEQLKQMFYTQMNNCSSLCTSKIEQVNFYEFCSTRSIYHGPFAPYSLTFNISNQCKDEIFSYDEAFDIEEDCSNLGQLGSVDPGKCHKVFCDCTDPAIGGERCNIQCSVGSDGSACNEDSNLGTCCLETESDLTLANCVTDVIDEDTSLFTGGCLCFSSAGSQDVGGINCDTFCDFCSIQYGKCEGSGACTCSANPHEETVLSNFYETEIQIVEENQLKFNWANTQSLGEINGLWNSQEPLLLLWTNEQHCVKSEIDKCCLWDSFISNTGNPLHDDYDRNILNKVTTGSGLACSVDIYNCAKEALRNNVNVIEIENEIYEIQNIYKNWPLKGEIRMTEFANQQEPTNLYNPATISQSSFFDSLCPSYVLVNGYYRVEAQKESWSKESICYDSSLNVAGDEGKTILEIHQLCLTDTDCLGYWKTSGNNFVRIYEESSCSDSLTTFYRKPPFVPVPVSTSLDVFFRNKWCTVQKVDGKDIEGNQFAGFVSKIECNRVKDVAVSTFNTCKFPFFINSKDQFDTIRTTKITTCTDENIYDPITNQNIFDFQSLASEIESTTGIQNPTYCVSEEWFQNTTRFNNDNSYCRLNDATYAKCTLNPEDSSNCECGENNCKVNEYCHVKQYSGTTLYECHSCSEALSPNPERCCNVGEYFVDGSCKTSCNEHWACRYNKVSTAEGSKYLYDGMEFEKGTGPRKELYCNDACWNPVTFSCTSCEECINSAPKKNPVDVLKDTKIGGYHFLKADGGYSFDRNDIDISFLRICQDTTNEIDNSDYALSVESKEIHDKIDFIMNDRSTSSNPSSRCGDSCHSICPGTSDNIPCSGHGLCNKDCSCSCFTLEENEKYFLSNVDGVGIKEIPQFGVGSAMAFKSPYRGEACESTCPGFEVGMLGNNDLSPEDKRFIMNELICSGHGQCLVNDAGTPQCQCEAGFINGNNMNCEFKCPGNGCSGHGECIVSLQGTPELYVPNLYVHKGQESISRDVLQKTNELFPSKSIFYNDEYFALPEAVEATQSSHFSTLKYLSKCPQSHPYPYNNGKHCCMFEKVANGTTINKRSAVDECSIANRIQCPTNSYYGDAVSQFIDPLKQTSLSDICRSSIKTLEEQAFCDEEERIIAINTYTNNQDDYTCDPSISIVNMRRNSRPFYDPISILQLGAGDTDSVMYKFNDVYCSNIVASAVNSNGKTLDEQPQPITLLECATCSCQKSATSGMWAGVICDDCAYGFHGESCSGMCAAVCGKVNVGTSELFYEEYQRRIGSTLPCDTPVNDNSAFYFSCPSVEDLQSILNTQGVTLDSDFERNIFVTMERTVQGHV